MVNSFFKNKDLVVTLFLCFFFVFSHPTIGFGGEELPPWVTELNEASQASSEAIVVPPKPSMDKQTRRENLQRLLVEIDSYAEALRIMTKTYTVFLDGVAKVNATCDVDIERSKKKIRGAFGWIYQAEVNDCQNRIGTLKDYARNLGIQLAQSEQQMVEFKQHAMVISRVLDRMRALDEIEKLEIRAKQGKRILDNAQDKLNRLSNPNEF